MKTLRKFTLTLGLLLALCSPKVYAQSSDKLTTDELKQVDFSKPISSTQTADRKFTLVFVDTQKRSIIKTFDIRQNNPFATMGKKTSDLNYDVYEFESKKLKDVFPNFNYEHYVNKEELSDTISINKFSVAYKVRFSSNKQFAVVSYTASITPLACRSIIVVFDSNGIEITRYSVDLGIQEMEVTNDGKFLVVSYEWRAPDYGFLIKSGIKIISINNNILIVDKEINNLSGLFCINDMVIAGTHNYFDKNGIRVKKRYFFDLGKNKIYIRELNVDCIGGAEIDAKGIIMHCLNGDSYTLSFQTDFEVEDLK